MGDASRAAGVPIVTGDTKVVERGKADGVFISTACVGVVPAGLDLSGDKARPGDVVLLSGSIGDHGVAVMSRRENLSFDTRRAVRHGRAARACRAAMVEAAGPAIRLMRDPTRGGARRDAERDRASSPRVGVRIEEEAIPVAPQVAAACELLGLDPLLRRQ